MKNTRGRFRYSSSESTVCFSFAVIAKQSSYYSESKPPAGKKQLGLLAQCTRIILNKNSPNLLPESYEGIYNACRSLVTISHLGHDLYDVLKLELEKSIGHLANELLSLAADDTTWIISLNGTFKWFENQIVGHVNYSNPPT
jgi:hypothetical protein